MLLQKVSTIFLFQFALVSALFLAGNCGAVAQPKTGTPSPSPTPEGREKDEDRIYTFKEVDTKAKVTNVMDNPPKRGKDCSERTTLTVTVRAVLRRSGDVTDVELVRASGCDSYDRSAIESVGKMKFTAAVKAGRKVSQYQEFILTNTQY